MRNDINLLQDARIEPEHSEIEIERHDQTEFNDLNNLNNHFFWGESNSKHLVPAILLAYKEIVHWRRKSL